MPAKSSTCPGCGRPTKVTPKGKLWGHRQWGQRRRCPWSGATEQDIEDRREALAAARQAETEEPKEREARGLAAELHEVRRTLMESDACTMHDDRAVYDAIYKLKHIIKRLRRRETR